MGRPRKNPPVDRTASGAKTAIKNAKTVLLDLHIEPTRAELKRLESQKTPDDVDRTFREIRNEHWKQEEGKHNG